MFLARVGARGAATLPVHGAHTVAQPVGASNSAAATGHSSMPGSIGDGCTKRKSAPDLSSCVAKSTLASASDLALSSTATATASSASSSPRVSPLKQLVGGGRNPELADGTSAGNSGSRSPWRTSMVDVMTGGARRSWATLSQMSF
ncbi:hypothetical protein SYNPS1DRAFT_21444 [Syncephalis pseudoplumigaleata]|uniref:Uncharacterized protein n=1 Tax=Syncephalis pseudoplumigaleata TaxID=1712513 RepID=A0A4P9Z4A7_9FUNG|nr:hypothetical protein SYNPS1DRAFT_21444 [Syncephalis pseudoplumigaleata]|eukprot:RKP26892.1 hypothetical protein SYNPS1DRAFT_21444 [Syncephalis pseudoplumigaleata]